MTDTAKVFWTGPDQAVRLPKEYRFEGDEVRIRRMGPGIYLEPQGADLVARQAADEIEWLRQAIREGMDTDGDAPWDAEAIKRAGRERLR